MNYFFYGLLSWLLVPIAIIQALKVRRVTPRLPPPPGRTSGIVGDVRGRDAAFRILVVGDSSAAGVGADRMEDTLAPNLAQRLHRRYHQPVGWRTAGANSATTEELRDHIVPNLAAEPYTHIVILAGTNDMKNFLSRRRFDDGFGGMLFAMHAKWPDATMIWSPIIDMRTVPALPWPLGHILELRVKMMNALGEQLCRERFAIAAPQLQAHDLEGFARDGFHASAKGYGYWADLLAEVIFDAEDRRARGLFPVRDAEAEISVPDVAMPGE